MVRGATATKRICKAYAVKRVLPALAASLALAFALALCACDSTGNGANEGDAVGQTAPGAVGFEGGGVSEAGSESPWRAEPGSVRPIPFEMAADYGEATASALEAASAFERDGGVYGVEAMAVAEESGVEAPASDMPSELKSGESLDEAAVDPAPMAGEGGYSTTNVQVAGIDEGDIVKTDGRFIYILRDGAEGRELLIASAEGPESAILGRVAAPDYGRELDSLVPEGASGYESQYSNEIYIAGDYLAIVGSYYLWSSERIEGQWISDGETRTTVDIYDVSDPAAPTLLCNRGQSGDFRTSRLVDGRLYLLSSYSPMSYGVSFDEMSECAEEEPESLVPKLFGPNGERSVEADTIALFPERESAAYSILACYDIAALAASFGGDEGAVTSLELMCDATNLYMDGDSAYLWSTSWSTEEGEPYPVSVYSVVDCRSVQTTDVYRVVLDGAGGMSLGAAASVPGYLDGQFSMDEYEGHLRIATTSDTSSYRIYIDEAMGFTNYADNESSQTNQLFVLDENLVQVGVLSDFVADERVYSVRFNGPVGYVCTFRETDPLFAIDLSDPSNPTMLSALEIPGFSEYLHVYGEGRLFGFGQSVDSEQGWTNGLKLSMFDVGDPTAVVELATLGLENTYSEALSNHHAIVVAPAFDFIGFPTETGFAIYGYSDESGFYERAFVGTGEWAWNLRGLYVGSCAYVVSNDAIVVLDMEGLEEVGRIAF